MICSYAIMKKLLRCRLSSAHVRFDLSHRGTRCQLFIYLLNYQTKQRYRWEMMKQELHQLTKYLDLPQMNYLSYPPVTNHNIVSPAMSNNRGVHAHSCIMGNLGKMARMSNYRNVWENQGFLKTDHGLLCTSDLVYRFFELVSYFFQRESIKYMNSGRNIWLWILLQIFYWLPWLPMLQLWAWTPLLRICLEPLFLLWNDGVEFHVWHSGFHVVYTRFFFSGTWKPNSNR